MLYSDPSNGATLSVKPGIPENPGTLLDLYRTACWNNFYCQRKETPDMNGALIYGGMANAFAISLKLVQQMPEDELQRIENEIAQQPCDRQLAFGEWSQVAYGKSQHEENQLIEKIVSLLRTPDAFREFLKQQPPEQALAFFPIRVFVYTMLPDHPNYVTIDVTQAHVDITVETANLRRQIPIMGVDFAGIEMEEEQPVWLNNFCVEFGYQVPDTAEPTTAGKALEVLETVLTDDYYPSDEAFAAVR